MSSQAPRQALLILDVQDTLALEDIRARLPEPPEGEATSLHERRLLTQLRPPWPTSRPPDSHEWQSWARQLEGLVTELRALQQQSPATELQLYVAGDAPLPLFVQLGRLLSSWSQPIAFFDIPELGRAQKKWEEVHIPPLSGQASQGRAPVAAFFDQRDPLEAPSAAPPSQLPIFLVSSRGMGIDRGSLAQLEPASATAGPPYLVEIGTRSFKSLSSKTVQQAERELQAWFATHASRAPDGVVPRLALHGTPLLGFIAGRALSKTPIEVLYFANHRYLPALRLPLPPLQPTYLGLSEIIRVCLVHKPAKGVESRLYASLADHLNASNQRDTVVRLEVAHIHDVPAGSEVATEQARLIGSSDIVLVLLSPEFDTGPLAQYRELLATHPGVIPVFETDGGTPLYSSTAEREWLAADTRPIYSSRRELQSLPRDGRPLRGRSRSDLDALLAELTREVRARAHQIAETRRSRTLTSPHTASDSPPSLSWEAAGSVAEFLNSLEHYLHTVPRLRCTEEARYDAWYGLVSLLERIYPDKEIAGRLNAPSAERQENYRRSGIEIKQRLTQPADPLGFVLECLDIQHAVKWLYLGAVEVRSEVRFPRYDGKSINLLERLQARNADLRDEQRDWLRVVELVERGNCSGLLASLPRRLQPPIEEVRQAIALIDAFRENKPLPALPSAQQLEHFLSGMLLNLIAAQAWFRGETALAFAAYQEAQKRGRLDQDDLVEWVGARGLHSLLRLQQLWDLDLGASAEDIDRSRLEQCWRDLEKKPQVAVFHQQVQQRSNQAKAGLLGLMQRAHADSMPTLWQEGWHQNIRALLQDQEELGLPPGWAGASAELLVEATLLTPDGVAGCTLTEGCTLLCRYGHSTELKHRNLSPLLDPQRTDHAAIFTQVLTPGRTKSEWLARFAVLASCVSALPVKLIPQAEKFFQELLLILHTQSEEVVHYLHGSVDASFFAREKYGEYIEGTLLFAGLNSLNDKLIISMLERAPEWAQIMIASKMHQFYIDGQGRDTIAELAKIVNNLFLTEQSRELLSQNIRTNDGQLLVGMARVICAIRCAGIERHFEEELSDHLVWLIGQGWPSQESQKPWLINTVLGEPVIQALQPSSGNASPKFSSRTPFDDIMVRVFDLLGEKKINAATLEKYARLTQVRQFLHPHHRQRLWDAIVKLEVEGELAVLASRAGAAEATLWIAAALLHEDNPELRALGHTLVKRSPAVPEGLRALASMPAIELDHYHAVVDQAIRHCLQEKPYKEVPWFSAEASASERFPWENTNIAVWGLEAIHNHLWFHPRRPVPSGWISLGVAQLFRADRDCVHAALQMIDDVLGKQPEVVNLETAALGLSFVLKRGPVENRDYALRILVSHRELLKTRAAEAVNDALAPHDPPRTLGALWAWHAGTRGSRSQ